jgi:hypothetical protein
MNCLSHYGFEIGARLCDETMGFYIPSFPIAICSTTPGRNLEVSIHPGNLSAPVNVMDATTSDVASGAFMCMDAFRCSDFSPCSYHPDA